MVVTMVMCHGSTFRHLIQRESGIVRNRQQFRRNEMLNDYPSCSNICKSGNLAIAIFWSDY